MLAAVRSRLLRILRVPHDPEPPLGAPGSTKIFRAAKNFYYVRLARWLLTQIGAVIGIAFSIGFIANFRDDFEAAQAAREQRAHLAAVPPSATASTPEAPAPSVAPKGAKAKRDRGLPRQVFFARTPYWVLTLVEIAELAGIAVFLLQLPITFAAVRLDWELRWYIVTDRSLRIRAGIWSLQESTMSFANLQQVEVSQGPVQRLLGIADVRVQSAGGGRVSEHGKDAGESLHAGVFHGVDNAQEIRDLVLDRLRLFRQAGLGDPDDAHASVAPAAPVAEASTVAGDTLAAARELLAEARALRATVS
ncbi:MAG: PH domain-containing protein [Candidatus Didemnitutus sp.]|nr:PH domain-containing protein [Candidatus Didemnitutus sp.]